MLLTISVTAQNTFVLNYSVAKAYSKELAIKLSREADWLQGTCTVDDDFILLQGSFLFNNVTYNFTYIETKDKHGNDSYYLCLNGWYDDDTDEWQCPEIMDIESMKKQSNDVYLLIATSRSVYYAFYLDIPAWRE